MHFGYDCASFLSFTGVLEHPKDTLLRFDDGGGEHCLTRSI